MSLVNKRPASCNPATGFATPQTKKRRTDSDASTVSSQTKKRQTDSDATGSAKPSRASAIPRKLSKNDSDASTVSSLDPASDYIECSQCQTQFLPGVLTVENVHKKTSYASIASVGDAHNIKETQA